MSKFYPIAKYLMMKGELDLTSVPIIASLVNDTYVYSDAHTSMDESVSSSVVRSVNVNHVSVGDPSGNPGYGVFDCDNLNMLEVPTGHNVNGLVFYSVDTPILYLNGGVGLPFVSSGGDVEINFSNGTNRVAKL